MLPLLIAAVFGGMGLWAVALVGRDRWRRSEGVQDQLWAALELTDRAARHGPPDTVPPLTEESVELPRTPPGITVDYDEAGGTARVWLGKGRELFLDVRGAELDARWVRDGWRPERRLVLHLAGVSAAVEFPDAVRLELPDQMVWVDLDGATTTERRWIRAWLLQGARQARRALTDARPDGEAAAALEALRGEVDD